MKKRILAGLLAGASLAVAALNPAQATPITWHLENVAFTDGAKASGSFVFDADTRQGGDFNVSVEAGTLSSFTYDNRNSRFYSDAGLGQNSFILFLNDGLRYFNFSFVTALDDAGGTRALNLPDVYECGNCSPYRYAVSGSVTAADANDVPEPASLALLSLGLLGMTARRRKANS